ncbi:MAG: glycoside hydrolase family 3 C-terminal domain-containing protein [Butyrivibrio sp.]|nr:glycoside hydrolase family 3 C-terminal domain-containing protein [Butyrivibrio sp.]
MDKIKRKKLARKLAEESIILLKNERNLLPLQSGSSVAFLGRGQLDMIYSGNGSGSAGSQKVRSILEACKKCGIFPLRELETFYQSKMQQEPAFKEGEIDWSRGKELVNSGLMYEIFGKYHPPIQEYVVPNDMLRRASLLTGTAVCVLTRNSGGEECDRRLIGDYELTVSEQDLIAQACQCFDRIVLIVNANGLIDLGWTKNYPQIQSILFIGIPGEEGADALAGILVGKVNPSGKLPVTIAWKYQDYPTAEDFSCNKDLPEEIKTYESYGLPAVENGSIGHILSPVTVYREDIYMGYRYFDSFGVDTLYPFGYGLSYTSFAIRVINVRKEDGGIGILSSVSNTGDYPGKEVIQLYISTHGTRSEHAKKELKGIRKTCLLEPARQQEVYIFLPWRELACYSEQEAAWIIEAGRYAILIGNSSHSFEKAADIVVGSDIKVFCCQNRLNLRACNQGKISFLHVSGADREPYSAACARRICLSAEDVLKTCGKEELCNKEVQIDCRQFKESALKKTGALTELQKACLLVGYGPGTAFSAFKDNEDPETWFDEEGMPITLNDHQVGMNGYVSPAILDVGIHSVSYKDGPAGIGRTAWPTQMLLAASFDIELLYEFGSAVGDECKREKVDVWLGPALNLHRNPLCGRNFEYFSEDPFLAGICGMAVVKGVQENNPVLACPKHFAANEQETFRRGSSKRNYDAADSILTERAARELYLKPFQMVIQGIDIYCLMTSFNKINGTFAGGNSDLCTAILRNEWGYQGMVVTDWGDMDIVVDGADAVMAGNDVIMPGGPPVIEQILKGLQEGRLTHEKLDAGVLNLFMMLQKAGKIEI